MFDELTRAGLLASSYEDVLSILGDTGVVVPMGDPLLSKLGATTLTTIPRTASGLTATCTWTSAPKDLTIAPSTHGLVPAIALDGLSETLTADDDDYWSFGADGTAPNEPAFSIGMWIHPTLDSTVRIILKGNENTVDEYNLQISSTGQILFTIADADLSNRIGRLVNTGANFLVADQWQFVVCTYDGSAASSGMAIYKNAVAVDDAGNDAGAYTAMENTAQGLRISMDGGLIAGGPIGPFFVNKELAAAEVVRLYHIGERLMEVS